MVEASKTKVYGALELPAKIVHVERVQEPGFGFTSRYCDEIAMWGYRPTDCIYSVAVEFGKEAGWREGHFSGRFLSIPELAVIGNAYNVSKPEDLVGKEIICRYRYNPEKDSRNLAAIIGIDPKI